MSKVVWSETSPLPLRSQHGGVQLQIVTYATSRFRAFFLDCTKDEAKARFEKTMLGRNPLEVEDEGWEASIETITFSENGEALVGPFGEQMRSLVNKLLGLA